MKSDKKKGDEEVADQNTKSDILLYENIFRQYYEALIRYAFRFVNDAMVAENIIHDVFYTYGMNAKELILLLI